jgi:hypothetical protein
MTFMRYLLLILVIVAAAAAVTLAPSYRDCVQDYDKSENQSPSRLPPNVQAFIDCQGEFLDRNQSVLTSLAIVLIAFFTLALQRSTARLWKAGERQLAIAETTAQTARLSAQAVVDAERAHLFVSVRATNVEQPLQRARLDNAPQPTVATPIEPPCVEYVLTNHGRTPALLKEIKHGLTWESTDGLRNYQPSIQAPVEVLRPNADSRPITCRFRGDFTTREARSIVDGKRALWFFGEAVFVDAFGRARGIRWQCRCAGASFDLAGFQEFEPAPTANGATGGGTNG